VSVYNDDNNRKELDVLGKYKCEFLRVEKKYRLDAQQYAAVTDAVLSRMSREHYGASNILNIYYDTPDWRLIRASIEKPYYKEKLRLRAYGSVTDDSEVFIEIKKKFNGVVYKRRCGLPLADARLFLGDGSREPGSIQVLREADWMLNTYGLSPAAAISYERAAFAGKEDPDFRVTIDRNLKGRKDSLDLKFGGAGDEILGSGQYLMEIKTAGAMPMWMCRLLDDLRVFPTSFSKYGEYYKHYIIGAGGSASPAREELVKSA
jgi:hypothetical protein